MIKKKIIGALALLSTSLMWSAPAQSNNVKKTVITVLGVSGIECRVSVNRQDVESFGELAALIKKEVPREKYRLPFLLSLFTGGDILTSTLCGFVLGSAGSVLAANKIFNLELDKVGVSWRKGLGAIGSSLGGGLVGSSFLAGLHIALDYYTQRLAKKYEAALKEYFAKLVAQGPQGSFAQLLSDKDFVANYTSYLVRARCSK